MNLSFKDTKFIIEAIDSLLSQYHSRIEKIEDSEEHEDEVSDLSNDSMFLESLKQEIEKSLSSDREISFDSKNDRAELDSIAQSSFKLSVNERLLLVEAITQSIRKETDLIAS